MGCFSDENAAAKIDGFGITNEILEVYDIIIIKGLFDGGREGPEGPVCNYMQMVGHNETTNFLTDVFRLQMLVSNLCLD